MKYRLLAPMVAVAASLSFAATGHSQDFISDVKVAVVAENADIVAVVKAAAESKPTQAAEIAQAAVKALELRAKDAADEAVIESIIQAAIQGAKANADQAKSIRAVAESALLHPDNSSKPIQGGEVTGQGNPLDPPGFDPLGSPLDSFNMGGTGGGTTGGGGGIGGGGIGSLLGRIPAGGLPGGFIGATPGSGGDTPGGNGDLGVGNGGSGGGLVNPPVVTKPAP